MSGKARREWSDEELLAFADDYSSGMPVVSIASKYRTSKGAVYVRAADMGIHRPSKKTIKKRARTDGGSARRFKPMQAPAQKQRKPDVLEAWHPAARDGSTRYAKSVTPASHMERLLKSGQHNIKIGKACTKGRWKGMPIYTLTLEERATCPRTCLQWHSCYGNNMGQAQRVHDDGWLTTKLYLEMVLLAQEHPDGFIVRLHVLGDFMSTKYVQFWDDALSLIPQLHIFGFTAWLPDTPIGQALVHLMYNHLDQVAIRWSGLKQELHGSEVIQREEDAIGIVCPAQKDTERYCGNCALCWNSERTISFLEH